MKKELLESILNALPYEIVFCDRNHTIQYLNKTAKQHYGERIHIGDSIFNCHNQESKKKIMNFLEKADAGSDFFSSGRRKYYHRAGVFSVSGLA